MTPQLEKAASPGPSARAAGPSPSLPKSQISDPLVWVALVGLLLLVAACWTMQEQELPLWAAAALSGGLVAWLHVSRVSAGHPEALESLEDSPINRWKIFVGLPVSFGLATVAGWQTAEG